MFKVSTLHRQLVQNCLTFLSVIMNIVLEVKESVNYYFEFGNIDTKQPYLLHQINESHLSKKKITP